MKEARVISAIATRVRLPRDHANAFIIRLCTAEITTPRTIFLSKMIEKGQALAIQAIDAIVAYFLAFLAINEKQPLLWHRALFDFVKRYATDVTLEQRDALVPLVRMHPHAYFTGEIGKVFDAVPPREDMVEAETIPVL
jgi:hypothetical protein